MIDFNLLLESIAKTNKVVIEWNDIGQYWDIILPDRDMTGSARDLVDALLGIVSLLASPPTNDNLILN